MGRRLGQHFLTRKSILEKIAAAACGEAAGTDDGPWVIEIGPGRGSLTECLLERASRVTAIEIDPVLVHYLRQKFRDRLSPDLCVGRSDVSAGLDAPAGWVVDREPDRRSGADRAVRPTSEPGADTLERERRGLPTEDAGGRLTLIEDDFLKTDLAGLLQGRPAVVTGNLPYYITSPILQRVFALGPLWERGVFLVQAEVAARLAASPGGRDYGFLSVLAQVHARAEILFPVERAAFRPPPKVDSAVVRLEPRGAGEFQIGDLEAFLRFASACFRHKRKTLRNNLAPLYGRERMDALVEGRLRAEQLGVAELAALHRKLEASA